MAITSKQYIVAAKKRKDEYMLMRDALMKIAFASETSDTDRIAAINTIFQIDTEGVPLPYK